MASVSLPKFVRESEETIVILRHWPKEGAALYVAMDCVRRKKTDEGSLTNGGVIGQQISVFGKYSNSDMLSWLKGLALDPCTSVASRNAIRPLWNQTLKVRKVMALSDAEFPRRKRKLQQFLKDKFAAARRRKLDISDQQSVTDLSKGELSRTSSVSCVLNSPDSIESIDQKIFHSPGSGSLLTSEDNFLGKLAPPEFTHLNDSVDWTPTIKNIFFPLIEPDESVEGLIPDGPQNMTVPNPTPLDLDDSGHSSNSSSSEVPKQEVHPQARRRSIRLLNFIGDSLQRMTIPIGPLFQADVPDWTDPVRKEIVSGRNVNSEHLKWLGTRIWLLEGSTETVTRECGKGRPDSCRCVFPGSAECTKLHILEERVLLRSHLGPAFLSWKFDEMGEEVSESWTVKEQESFASLANKYPLSKGKNFLKHALKCFPSKGKKSILSYYFNVFIPRRMSLQTGACLTI